jgi:hypothetical protein
MMKKKCNRCGDLKLITDFEVNRANKDGHNTICKTCVYETNCKRRALHPEELIHENELKQQGVSRDRDYVYGYLQGKRCLDCGESRWQVLEFDHVQGKKIRSISWMIGHANSIARIQAEIDKCEIRCGNCHRIKSTNELGNFKIGEEVALSNKKGNLSYYRRRNRIFIYDILKQSACVDCGTTLFGALEFDHVRGVKAYSITYLVHHGMSLNTIKSELEKCDVRCVNCHRMKTIEQFGWAKATWAA